MTKRRLIVDVSNLSTDAYRWLKTGIQEYNFRIIQNFIKLRPQFPDYEIILHPRFKIWGLETNSACILAQVEEALGLNSEDIWGYNLKSKGYYVKEKFSMQLTKNAYQVHFQSILDLSYLIRSGQVNPKKTALSAVIYDLIAHYFPEFFIPEFSLWYRENYLQPMGRYMEKMICISRSTAIDLHDYYGDQQKGKISYLKIPAELDAGAVSEEALLALKLIPMQYILAAGSLEPRKNIIRLIEGWELFRKKFPESTIKLLLVGGTGWLNSDIFLRINESTLKNDIILPGYVPDSDLASLMHYSGCVAMLSIYEGLGLPLAQAHAMGVPVLTHIGSSLPEACSLEGVFVNPADSWSVAAGIRQIFLNPSRRLIAPNFEQNTNGWEKYAKAILTELCQ